MKLCVLAAGVALALVSPIEAAAFMKVTAFRESGPQSALPSLPRPALSPKPAAERGLSLQRGLSCGPLYTTLPPIDPFYLLGPTIGMGLGRHLGALISPTAASLLICSLAGMAFAAAAERLNLHWPNKWLRHSWSEARAPSKPEQAPARIRSDKLEGLRAEFLRKQLLADGLAAKYREAQHATSVETGNTVLQMSPAHRREFVYRWSSHMTREVQSRK